MLSYYSENWKRRRVVATVSRKCDSKTLTSLPFLQNILLLQLLAEVARGFSGSTISRLLLLHILVLLLLMLLLLLVLLLLFIYLCVVTTATLIAVMVAVVMSPLIQMSPLQDKYKKFLFSKYPSYYFYLLYLYCHHNSNNYYYGKLFLLLKWIYICT